MAPPRSPILSAWRVPRSERGPRRLVAARCATDATPPSRSMQRCRLPRRATAGVLRVIPSWLNLRIDSVQPAPWHQGHAVWQPTTSDWACTRRAVWQPRVQGSYGTLVVIGSLADAETRFRTNMRHFLRLIITMIQFRDRPIGTPRFRIHPSREIGCIGREACVALQSVGPHEKLRDPLYAVGRLTNTRTRTSPAWNPTDHQEFVRDASRQERVSRRSCCGAL